MKLLGVVYMFSESASDENKAMMERWRKRCTELYGEAEFKTRTDSGIEVKPLYTPADIEAMDYKDIALPGEYPFTRGHSPLHYQVEPRMMRPFYGYGTPAETERRRGFLQRLGMSQSEVIDCMASGGSK